MLWFQFGCGLERKISLSTLVCPVPFQERSIKCFGCFKREQEHFYLGSSLTGLNRKITA